MNMQNTKEAKSSIGYKEPDGLLCHRMKNKFYKCDLSQGLEEIGVSYQNFLEYIKNEKYLVALLRGAVMHGRMEAFKLLLSKISDYDCITEVLSSAVIGNQTEIIKIFLERKNKFNLSNNTISKAIETAYTMGRLDTLRILIEHLNNTGDNIENYWHAAIVISAIKGSAGHIECLKWLLKNSNQNFNFEQIVIDVCRTGSIEAVEILLREYAGQYQVDLNNVIANIATITTLSYSGFDKLAFVAQLGRVDGGAVQAYVQIREDYQNNIAEIIRILTKESEIRLLCEHFKGVCSYGSLATMVLHNMANRGGITYPETSETPVITMLFKSNSMIERAEEVMKEVDLQSQHRILSNATTPTTTTEVSSEKVNRLDM
jgi:hypothetical protein